MEPRTTPWRVLDDGSPSIEPAAAPSTGVPPIPRAAVAGTVGAVAVAVAAFVIAFGAGSSGAVTLEGERSEPLGASGGIPARAGASQADGVLVVEIVGAVEHPGVFRLPRNARVGELITAAGGYGPRVDAERAGQELNLAAVLHDGDQVRVPSRDDPSAPTARAGPSGDPGSGSGAGYSRPVSLGRATQAELEALPGIGPATAAKIIASRQTTPFTAVSDLRTRKLVGEKTFAQLRDLVTVP